MLHWLVLGSFLRMEFGHELQDFHLAGFYVASGTSREFTFRRTGVRHSAVIAVSLLHELFHHKPKRKWYFEGHTPNQRSISQTCASLALLPFMQIRPKIIINKTPSQILLLLEVLVCGSGCECGACGQVFS